MQPTRPRAAEETNVHATGASAAIETTGLAAQALLKSNPVPTDASKALLYLTSHKNAAGTWGTTQATIMALRALLLSADNGAGVRGQVQVSLDGKPVETLALNEENNELFHQFALKGIDVRRAHRVALSFAGEGRGLAYQVVGRHFVPWKEKSTGDALEIDISYDRTRLWQDDMATATAIIKNNLDQPAKMVMVELGIPPGFELQGDDLRLYQEQTAKDHGGRLEKFNLTATQAILYFDDLPPKATLSFQYRLKPKYPIRVRTFESRVYEYYDPEVSAIARPMQLEVSKR